MEALTGAMNAIVAYIPNILAAIAILLVGWLSPSSCAAW